MDLTEQNWEPYYGGSVSFNKHIGRPLSQALWEDLIHRLAINGLCIYRHWAPQWTIGWLQGHCCVHLDQKDNVREIDFSPYNAHLYIKRGEE